jgi:cytoskeleton protein RodZ
MATETESTETGTSSADFGPHLRQLREKSGLTLGELSRQTRIPTDTLEALESERLERLPPETYVRGFIRVFAQAVKTSATGPLERYDRATAAARAKALAESGSPAGSRMGAGRRRRVIAALLLVLALSAAVVFLWRA